MSITNEELALLIQNGRTDLYPVLWEKTKKLLFMLVMKYYNKYTDLCKRRGIELEDLKQSCFIALHSATMDYKEESGYKLTSYFNYAVKNTIEDLLGSKSDSLNNSLSLDEPISDEDGEETFLDMYPDEKASADFEQTDYRIFNRDLHKMLNKALSTLSDDNRCMVELHYYSNATFTTIAEMLSCSKANVSAQVDESLYKLRTGKYSRKLREFLYDACEFNLYSGTGFNSWKDNGSVQERFADTIQGDKRNERNSSKDN